MAPAPNRGSAATALITGPSAVGLLRWLALASPHIAVLALMFTTEADFSSRLCFLLTWGFLNSFWIALVRRPALSGALSLTLVVVLVLLSRFKHDVVQMTANFVDLMVIDGDTAAFLFTIFPNLRRSVIATALVIIPLMYVLWRLDPFRIRRLPALAATLSCLAALSAYALSFPDEDWRSYDDDEYLSKFARSGIIAVSDFVRYGFMESDAMAHERLKVPLIDSCHPAGRRPNIIVCQIMSHAGNNLQYSARNMPGGVLAAFYGNERIVGAMDHQRRNPDPLEKFDPAPRCKDRQQVAPCSRRIV